jgi:DNA polymerase III subunit tau-like protein
VELSQLQEAWSRTIVPAVAEKSIPISTVLGEARPAELEGDTLTVEFPASASFHRQLAEEPKNATLLRDALYEVTGRKLALAFAVGEDGEEAGDAVDEGPAGEERFLELMKETFDAREREPE